MQDKEELSHQFACSKWSHRMSPDDVLKQHVRIVSEASEKAKSELDCQVGRTYGESDRQKFDIFGVDTLPGDAPVFVFIHGGYWQEMSREQSSFYAIPLSKAGAVLVTIGYDLAPKVSLPEIVSQCKRAMVFIMNFAKNRGSRGVYISGHSAGGHLAAMMLAVDWMSESMLPNSLIKGAALVSGIFDLQPLVNTDINDAVQMTDEIAVENSPMRLVENVKNTSSNRSILIAVGDHDPPALIQQSEQFEQKLKESGVVTKFIKVADCDHFNVIENLQNEDYILTKEIVNMMNLNLEGVDEALANSALNTM